MIKFAVTQWDLNKNHLKEWLLEQSDETLKSYEYIDLVKIMVNHIFNHSQTDYEHYWDANSITEIDNGNYQGTLLYLIPKNTYQPGCSEYLMTNVYYGSCSYCDTLMGIKCHSSHVEMVEDYMTLILNLVQETIRPYNQRSYNPNFDDISY